MGKTILIAGGTGLVGTALCEKLSVNGFQVHLLSRNSNTKYPTTIWDPKKQYYDKETIPEANVIINLAGSGIADKRWTVKRKQEIIDSRIDSNKLIQEIISAQKTPVSLYISASAIGIYGDRGTELLSENSAPGNKSFLSETVKAWENAINAVASKGMRTIVYRFGMVLSMNGGALVPLVKPLSFGVAPYFGKGQNMVSWIHIDDLCEIILYGIKNEAINGTYNAVSPGTLTNKELVKTIRLLRSSISILLSVPEFLLRIILGEMADIILDSDNVSAAKLIAAGYKFRFPGIQLALQDIFDNKK